MTKPNAATSGLTDFRRSRIYAEGWNAARKSVKRSENPYRGERERRRWLEGYTQAMA
jgi:ribosome modulation factor